MSSKSKRLTINEKLEIIDELSQPNHASKRSLGTKFGVSETAIRQTWKMKDSIRKRSAELAEDYKTKKSRISVRR